jgi:hypothetical protein
MAGLARLFPDDSPWRGIAPVPSGTMAATRTELVARMQALDAGLEERIERNPDTADPWPEVGSLASAIRAAAAPQDREYVRERIENILAKHGIGNFAAPAGPATRGHSHWRAQ